MSNFCTIDDVAALSGKAYTSAELERIGKMIPLICDALRLEADKVGKNLDYMRRDIDGYDNVLKLVTADIVIRVMRQTFDGDPMSQESQTALGYTWSGTYAIPGGGIAGAIMRNDLKRLGLKRQRYGVMDLWDGNRTECQ
jgi:hypothetical protein